MYRSLGGIAPATPGYATATIAPQISKTLGPNAVNASVLTVRGVLKSSWVRHEQLKGKFGECLLEMRVTVPVGSLARISIPLLGLSTENVSIVEHSENIQVWGGHQQHSRWLRKPPRAGVEPSGDATIELETMAGEFHFHVLRR
jgi:hypothetical protein